MSASSIGLLLVVAGLVLVLAGFALWGGLLSWIGHLPGDIRVERPSFTLFFPITSMLVVSVVLSLLLYLVRRWLGP